jgi:hypothetical protein
MGYFFPFYTIHDGLAAHICEQYRIYSELQVKLLEADSVIITLELLPG